jgi:hypothetical protein
MRYEAGIKVYQGKELIMHEEPETRAVMVETTEAVRLDMKYEAVGYERNQVNQEPTRNQEVLNFF